MALWENIVCRVCGEKFDADRVNATTCSGTCRQRLRRGGEFAYFAKLTAAQQEEERERHAGYDEQLRDHRALRAEKLARREENQKARRQRHIIRAAGYTRGEVETIGRHVLAGALEKELEEREQRRAESLDRLKRDLKASRNRQAPAIAEPADPS